MLVFLLDMSIDMVYGGGGSNVGVAMSLGKSTSLTPGCLPAHCRKAQKLTRLFDAFAGPNAVRPGGTQKKIFFPTFEAGMLLKTNEARNIRAAITQYVFENKSLIKKCL